MANQKVRVFRSGTGTMQTTQTPGMQRQELVSTPDTWVGMVQTKPKFTSGWHHHGEYDTYVYVIAGEAKLEFGENGKESITAKQGDVVFIPKNTVHRESNPGIDEHFLFGVRIGKGAPVFNVDGPTESGG
jgi:uncharacterized RmlC-like cupin family protein